MISHGPRWEEPAGFSGVTPDCELFHERQTVGRQVYLRTPPDTKPPTPGFPTKALEILS